MKTALQSKNVGNIAALGHHLKSTCANIGANQMRDLASQLELKSIDNHPSEFQKLIDALEIEYHNVVEELKKYADNSPEPSDSRR